MALPVQTGHIEEVALNYEKITHLYKDGNLPGTSAQRFDGNQRR